MKLGTILGLLCAGSASAGVLPRDQQPVQGKPAASGYNIGNAVEAMTSTYAAVDAAMRAAAASHLGSQQQPAAGISLDQPAGFVERVARMVLPEAKLHNHTVYANSSPVRRGSIKARSAFGPFKMVGKNDWRPIKEFMSIDPRGQGKVSYLPRQSFCGNKDCTILSARIGLTYANGSEASPATGVYVHHLLSFVPTRPSTMAVGFCDFKDPATSYISNMMPVHLPFAPFTGRGEDGGPVSMLFTSGNGAFNSGYHLGKDDLIFVQSDIVNYREYPQDVYLTYDYEYVEGLQGAGAITTLLSVTGCTLIIPPDVNATGRAITTSKKFPILADATLLNLRGHMHDGGDLMTLRVNDKVVCESYPEYKEDKLWSMTSCTDPIPVKKGDYLTMSSVYDAVKHPLRMGVSQHAHATNILGMNDLMGMWAVTFAAKN